MQVGGALGEESDAGGDVGVGEESEGGWRGGSEFRKPGRGGGGGI